MDHPGLRNNSRVKFQPQFPKYPPSPPSSQIRKVVRFVRNCEPVSPSLKLRPKLHRDKKLPRYFITRQDCCFWELRLLGEQETNEKKLPHSHKKHTKAEQTMPEKRMAWRKKERKMQDVKRVISKTNEKDRLALGSTLMAISTQVWSLPLASHR